MKIKLDENLPVRLANLLTCLEHGVHSTHEEGLDGHNDNEIWESAQKESRFLITQDLDFSDARRFAPGSHHGILLLRLHSPGRQSLIDRVIEIFHHENVSHWMTCFVVATERKIRVIKPAKP